ncbi:anthranilate phosphoribosyltransferase [Clostridium estertheticum]|uniref:anthranilate phosphoribosyltransferase n=1 Tax=Clostridium estertheticum TaxID=238834 RepID=UPI001C0E6AB8|nr:anthranilate phosphoribosyltransferase [Clostridium estertheticum]MBU3218014.1 anthranilate phosphoribosyltransferase [Clostridium estertheticum]WAG55362.1 anthranilate phosphoribosyltransferase [Clostridium estertheticum]
MLKMMLSKIIQNQNLTQKEAYDFMNGIMKGEVTQAQIGGFLVGLRMKGETIDEITGCAKAMRDNAKHVNLISNYAIDTCGTGGDGGKTFNISTASAIITSAGGVKVAKHGNRAVSSQSGSADVLTELGININIDPSLAANLIEEKGMAFLFAQNYHSAMKNAASPRREIGTRTIFNILGPLTNPAFVRGQTLGIFSKDLTNPVAKVLRNLGSERALVVHGEDGLDEITTTGFTYVSELKNGIVTDYKIYPEDLGIKRTILKNIVGGSAKDNAAIIFNVLKGEKGPQRDIVVINTAAALYIGKKCETIKEGVLLAKELIDSGKALKKLEELRLS